MRRILVIGLGNPDRGDDGIGPLVARHLEGRLPEPVALRIQHGDVLALLPDLATAEVVICIDAAAGAATGRIHRIDLGRTALPPDMSLMSSHGFGLGGLIELARALDQAPREIVVFAIESSSFAAGSPMTAEAAAAAATVAALVEAEVARCGEAVLEVDDA